MGEMKFTFQFDKKGFKGANASGENSDTFNFNDIKIILLMFTGSQDLYLGIFADLILGNRGKC